jgi:hypothetical protein
VKFLKQCSLVVMMNVGWKRCQASGSELGREMGSGFSQSKVAEHLAWVLCLEGSTLTEFLSHREGYD